jgi:hypothetical protein
MAIWYSQELTGSASQPVVKASAPQYDGSVTIYQASIVLASQLVADTIVIGNVQSGSSFLYGILSTDTSLATSTISIGTSASAAKYRALAVFTATNTPTPFGNVAPMANVTLNATEQQIITIAVATLPAAGNLIVQMFWASN